MTDQDGSPTDASAVSTHVDAPPERVFAQLADAWMYSSWVVGAAHIRDVDDNWPEPGSRLHHRVGPWPVSVDDTTKVLEMSEPRRLLLQARAWPFGEARVEILIEPDGRGGDGSRVTIKEAPTHGAASAFDNPVQRFVLRARNRESLARLKSIAEKRPETKRSSPG
jgi:uncharacterized protein YndB with AHSA1/START domain